MLRPLGKNILVQKKKEEAKPGKIILTSNNDDKPFVATILGFGNKVELEISVGDSLLLIPYAGSKISADDDGYLLVTERDILGVVNE